MTAESEIARSAEAAIDEDGLLTRFYLPFLLEAQNADGGWGYRRGGQSSVEPTCWALLALLGIQEVEKSRVEESKELTARAATPRLFDSSTLRLLDSAHTIGQAAVGWLRMCQLRDGSWPPFPGQSRGCWVTAMASLALYAFGGSVDHVVRGLQWLANAWPAEGGFWWRIGAKLLRRPGVVKQDVSLRGWSWTPGTASWVEPTSCALIAFGHIPEELHPREAGRHRRLAERMLYDRMCPGGGWNGGNPLVYGTAGIPRIGPTAWALLALQHCRDRTENLRSLDWLEQAYSQIHGPGSLALAHLCLEFYDRPVPPLEPSLAALNSNNQFLGHTLAAAWAAISLSGRPRWLAAEVRD